MDGKAILSNELMYEDTKPFIVSNLAEDRVFRRTSTGSNAFQHKMVGRYKFMFTMNSPLGRTLARLSLYIFLTIDVHEYIRRIQIAGRNYDRRRV